LYDGAAIGYFGSDRKRVGVADSVTVGFNRRYSPLSQQLVSEIRKSPESPLTIAYRVNAGVLEEGHWFYEDPGGRLCAEGCHFIDYCEFLVGQAAVRVSAVQHGPRGRPFDSFIVTLGFPDASLATVVYSGQGDRALRKERIEVYQNGKVMAAGRLVISGSICWRQGKVLYKGRQSKGWREEMEHFLGIRSYALCAPSWGTIVASHRTMFAAVASALGAFSQPGLDTRICES